LTVGGHMQWDPKRVQAGLVSARVASSGADGAYLCGLVDTGAAPILSAVRRALPREAPVVGCDGLLPASLLFERAGDAARDVRVTVEGVVPEVLPPAGKRFVRAFGATWRGKVDAFAVYAAQATEVL